MSSYLISGGRPLGGQITVHGSKNAALPIIAASLLHRGVTVLRGCPDILDVRYMLEILRSIGCEVLYQEDMLRIDASEIDLAKDAFFHFTPGSHAGTMPQYGVGLSRRLHNRRPSSGYSSGCLGADGRTY